MNCLEKLNLILVKHTAIKIVDLDKNEIVLSNGRHLITESEIRKFKRRVATEHPSYLFNFADIYSIDLTISAHAEKQIKQNLCRKGGLAVQKKYGNQIKRNLNTGVPWNKNTAGNYPYSAWSKGLTKETNDALKKLSLDRMGSGNPMYGKPNTEYVRKIKSQKMKEKILKGEFTPNTNNRNTHWESEYKGKKYRSSWEALCQHLYPHAEYETLRINYEYQNINLVYIVDFVDHSNKTAIEVKPKQFQTGEKYKCKMNALSSWCLHNGYQIKIFDQTDVGVCRLSIDEQKLFDVNTIRKLQKVWI